MHKGRLQFLKDGEDSLSQSIRLVLHTIAMDPTYPAFPIFAFVAFVLVLIPLPWHLQAWNSGTCLYMIWIAIGSLNFFINSIIWHGNAIDWAPIWCDICPFTNYPGIHHAYRAVISSSHPSHRGACSGHSGHNSVHQSEVIQDCLCTNRLYFSC